MEKVNHERKIVLLNNTMYYQYPYTCGSAYVLWKRLIQGRKTGLGRLNLYLYNCRDHGKCQRILWLACTIGDLALILGILKRADVSLVTNNVPYVYNNYAIYQASRYGHLKMVKWLYSMGCDPTADYNSSIEVASTKGHLRVVKWLYSVGCDPTEHSCSTIRMGSAEGHLKLVKWLYSVGCDPTVLDNYAISHACRNGHLRVVKWLYSVGCVPSSWSIHNAYLNGHLDVVKWIQLRSEKWFKIICIH